VLAFEHHALKALADLADALADGSYEPRPMTSLTIAKSAGGSRRIAVGAIEDRIDERAVLDVLDPLIDPLLSPWSFAYRRGLGVKDAVRALAEARESGARWIVRADFDECFDSIPRWPVLQRLAESVPDAELVGLVQRFVGRPVVGEHRSSGVGLHQGGGLSPLLANLYLDAFDRRMMSLGHQVVRYGDDIAIPIADRPSGERCLELAHVEAAAIKLRLETSKSLVVSYDEGCPSAGRRSRQPAALPPTPRPIRCRAPSS
jgi:CRISPR-associated protein Cas1